METKKFKPFERIIYKASPELKWDCDLYSYYNEEKKTHITLNHVLIDTQILPYEGNEELVGTTNEPPIPLSEKEIQDAYWNNCTEKEKENLRNSYNGFLKDDERGKSILEKTCGKHNLQVDSPDEEVRLEEGDWLMVCDEIGEQAYNWQLRYFLWINEDKICIQSVRFAYPDPCPYNYAIRLKDFDPSNMEETRKHILEVKNGKIIRYKE